MAQLSGCATTSVNPSPTDFSTPVNEKNKPQDDEYSQQLQQQPPTTAVELYSDVWKKIQHANTIEVHDDAEVRKKINFFSDKQKFITQISERAEPFLYYIVSQLEARNMPLELALLPIVESGYNPLAQANGPAGLWQMIPATGRNFGLTINSAYDGRTDALASTDAVLDYLQHLYDTLDKDWINAVAAYNIGELVIKTAIDKNKAKGKPTDFWSLGIAAKRVQTVPKWLAFIEIIRSPDHYNLKVPPIANRPFLDRVPAPNGVDIGQIAKAAGLSKTEFKTYNPGLHQGMIPNKGKYQIALPLANIGQYQENQGQLYAQKSNGNPKSYDGQSYIVKSGDSLDKIARKNKVKLADLMKWNQLNAKSIIKPGQKLKLSE